MNTVEKHYILARNFLAERRGMRERVVLTILMLLISISILSGNGYCKKLNIVVLNEDLEIINEIFEGETFLIYVSDSDDPSQPLDNYTVIFNNNEFVFGRDDPNYPFCYLTAPQVNHDQSFQILIKKVGYEDGKVTVTVKNRGKLFVYPPSFSVKSGHTLSIQVKDDNGLPVEGATVRLEVGSKNYTTKTDSEGIATITAPSVDTKTTAYLDVSKKGFESVKLEGTITPISQQGGFVDVNILKILALAFVIVFVFAGGIKYIQTRERILESIDIRGKNAERELISSQDRGVRKDVKIEEIVIGRGEEKKMRSTKTNSLPITFKPPQEKRTKPDTWIVGSRSIIRKIDEKLGGGEKRKDVEKWLTGKEDVIAKIDEKLKELEKKRKSNPP